MLKTKVMSKKKKSLGIERQSDLPEVIYIFRNNENTNKKINKYFLGYLFQSSSIILLKTKLMSKTQTSLWIEQQSDVMQVSYILKNNENSFKEITNNLL